MKKNTLAPHSDLFRWGLMSKYRGELFGFSILWIMFFHSGPFRGISHNPALLHFLPYKGWIRIGSVGVDSFLFLSGMGLYYAMERHPTLPQFYGKRLKRILIPYLIIGTPYWLFRDVAIKNAPELLPFDISLCSFYSQGNATFWYIGLILPLYLLAPFFLWLFRTRARKFFLYFWFFFWIVIDVSVALHFPEKYVQIGRALTRVFIFILGCYFGPIIRENRPMNRRWLPLSILVIASRGLVFYLSNTYVAEPMNWICNRLWYNAAGLSICVLISLLLELRQSMAWNRFLAFLGSISLELYLSHIAFRNTVKLLYHKTIPDWSTLQSIDLYLTLLLLAVGVSALFHLIQASIERSLVQRRGRRKELTP